MVYKVMILSVLVAVVSAGHHALPSPHIEKYDGHHKIVSHEHGEHHHHDYITYPKYKVEYKVEDHHKKDHKKQHDVHVHDDVKGFYLVREPDGTEKLVHYHSDKHSGIHADVKHSTLHVPKPHHHHY